MKWCDAVIYLLRGARRLVICIAGLLFAACAAHDQAAEFVELQVLHTNDVHAHLLQFNAYGSTCTAQDAAGGKCYGGVARRARAVKEARKTGGATLLVDAGDQFQGTLFFRKYKGDALQHFMNELGYDAATLGNHEFDEGTEVLGNYLRGLTYPVVAANIMVEADPALRGLVKPYTIIEKGGQRIGVIGVVSEEAVHTSHPGPDVRFLNIDQSVRNAVAALEKDGISIVLLLSHLGLGEDQALAARVSGIDLIVGGHTHSLLDNTTAAAEGPYPIVVRAPDGRRVLVVTASSYGRYLGDINVSFDGAGAITGWSGSPRLLNAAVEEDESVLAQVNDYKLQLEPFYRTVIGQTEVELSAADNACRFAECNFGNFAADALRWEGAVRNVEIAFLNGGSIRASIPAGPVTLVQLMEAMPFDNNIAVCRMRGRRIREALEHGVSSTHDPQSDGTGRFLQVSGMRYSWNPLRPAGQRITSVQVRQADGSQSPLADDREYSVATNSFIRQGGDAFALLKSPDVSCYDFGRPITDIMIDYFRNLSPLHPVLEGRILRHPQ